MLLFVYTDTVSSPGLIEHNWKFLHSTFSRRGVFIGAACFLCVVVHDVCSLWIYINMLLREKPCLPFFLKSSIEQAFIPHSECGVQQVG